MVPQSCLSCSRQLETLPQEQSTNLQALCAAGSMTHTQIEHICDLESVYVHEIVCENDQEPHTIQQEHQTNPQEHSTTHHVGLGKVSSVGFL